jgi:hypothetical protein
MVDHFTKPNGNFINVCDGGNSSVGFATWSSQESSTAEIDELIESDVTASVIIPYVLILRLEKQLIIIKNAN